MIKNSILIIFTVAFSLSSQDWQTAYERSGFKATAGYAETLDYCQRLADASPWIQFTNFGISPQGRILPLLIVDKNGNFSEEDVRKTDNVVFFIQAGIHAGEIDGKDAGLMLLRELAISKELSTLLNHVTILFNPIFNVDGHERFGAYNRANQNGPEEMGWRTTAQNLNLNRDYLKADAPEMQNWLQLYNEWLPEFFADCHVTDGADYQYAISYKMETHGILDPLLIRWLEQQYLPPLKQAMQTSGFPLIEYVTFKKRHDVISGMGTWAAPPRFSDGYTAIQNRPALLIETHMFKDYKTRVDATFEILKHTLFLLNSEYQTLRQKISEVDQLTSQNTFRDKPFTLTYKPSPDSVMIDFLGYEYEVLKSDITGANWFRYNSRQHKTFHIPFYNRMIPDISVHLPDAYIIPGEWIDVIERIKLHGIKTFTLIDSISLTVESSRFINYQWNSTPYEGRQVVSFEVEPFIERRQFLAGTVLIDMNQRAARVIANILEPKTPDSFVQWGFFNAIFERKEYVESYVMEERARMMLASDPDLKREFESKIQSDSIFSNDPQAILMWFYQKSPYWDNRKDIYPVAKINDRKSLNKLYKIAR